MCWVQLLTYAIQFLCISIPETLLQVTLKRRAEISAYIFAGLSRYFRLSCKNLTTMHVPCPRPFPCLSLHVLLKINFGENLLERLCVRYFLQIPSSALFPLMLKECTLIL